MPLDQCIFIFLFFFIEAIVLCCRVDDDSGDGLNSKISSQLFPDRDYFVQIQTFDPKGGSFEFSITSW